MAACDTSFLCALYLPQDHSSAAIHWYNKNTTPITVNDLVLMEFRHSIRLQSWLHKQDPSKGFTTVQGQSALNELEAHLAERKLHHLPCSLPLISRHVERISARHTLKTGCRIFDILLIAAALSFGEKEFLTFDIRQRKIAEVEGLHIPL